MTTESHSGRRDDSDLVISLDEARESFLLEDVTDQPGSLAWAFDLVVQGYLALSSQSLEPDDVRQDVCDDAYHRHGLARTLVLTGRHPETGDREPLGTMRVTTGSREAGAFGLQPLETMELMAPPQGWHSFDFQGFDVDAVAEGGRLAVSPTCRIGRSRETALTAMVLSALVNGTFQFAARHYGKTQLWGVLPYYVIERLEAIGMRVIPAHDVAYRAQDNARVFGRYDRYWRHGRPAFCKVIPPETIPVVPSAIRDE